MLFTRARQNACCVHIYRRQSQSSCNDRLFQFRDLEFMLARDAFVGFIRTFDAILQFRAQWRQKLRDGKDSSPLQVCDYSPTEAYLLSNRVNVSGYGLFLSDR